MLIVTIAALVMAASLGWFAYRLLQDEQRRSEARIALLTAALDDEPTGALPYEPLRLDLPVSRAAVTSAPVAPERPSVVIVDDDSRAMQNFASERRASPAAPVSALPSHDVLRTPLDVTEPPRDDHAPAEARLTGLFADVPEARPAPGRGLVAMAVVVLVAVLVAGYVWFGQPSSDPVAATVTTASADTAAAPASPTPAAAQANPAGVPLELLSLSHDTRNGALVVRGLVRNPVSGSDRAGVVASVMLLDQAGGFLGSGRAAVDTSRLRPGDDAGFSVRVASHPDVRRYRVTFRTPDDALIAHTDMRSARP